MASDMVTTGAREGVLRELVHRVDHNAYPRLLSTGYKRPGNEAIG